MPGKLSRIDVQRKFFEFLSIPGITDASTMDYTTQKLGFKIRKVLRYFQLYGIRRTLAKVNGQFHMKKIYSTLPAPSSFRGGHVGLIGCGNFAFSTIAYYLRKNYGRVIRGAMDIDIHKAASIFEHYGLSYYTGRAERILSDPSIDLIYIASNHASHAEYAISALRAGKSVHIEKPHVVNESQLERLCETALNSKGKVNLGFNRPMSRLGRIIKSHLDSQSGPAMFNWFIVGHEIDPAHWYCRPEEGGRVVGNLCHWTDFVLQLVSPENRYPILISPTRGKKSDCDIAVSYLFGDESTAVITFCARGPTFEGVRERFSAHRGNVLVSLDDFKDLSVDIVETKQKKSTVFRDHGHEWTIKRSYEMVRSNGAEFYPGCSSEYILETGNLFLKTREALKTNRQTTIYSPIPYK